MAAKYLALWVTVFLLCLPTSNAFAWDLGNYFTDEAPKVEQTTQDVDVLTSLLTTFKTKANAWGPIIQGAALNLFKTLAIIEFAWLGIQAALKRKPVEELFTELILLVFLICLMLSILMHYSEWSNQIITSLNSLAEQTGAPPSNPTDVFKAGLLICAKMLDQASLWSPITSTGMFIVAIALVVTYALIAAEMILVKCQAYIVLNAGLILLGFGGSKFTKDYAINQIRYVLSVAMKLFLMQLLIGLSLSFIDDFLKVNVKNLQDIFVVLGASIIILVLVKILPDIVAGIVNGSNVPTGNSLSSAVTSVSTATMAISQGIKGTAGGAISGAIGSKRSIDSIKEASSFAQSAGKTGLGKLGHMAGTGVNAMRDNLGQGKTGGIRSSVKAQHEAFKMQNADPKE